MIAKVMPFVNGRDKNDIFRKPTMEKNK